MKGVPVTLLGSTRAANTAERTREQLRGTLGVGTWLLAAYLASNALVFATGVAASRLGPLTYGIYAALIRLAAMLDVVTGTLQTTTNAYVAGSRASGSQRPLFRLVSKRLALSVAVMLPIALLLLLLLPLFQHLLMLPSPGYLLLLAVALPLNGLFAVAQGGLQGYERLGLSGAITLWWLLVRFGLVLLSVAWLQSLLGVVAAIPLSMLLALCPALLVVLLIRPPSRDPESEIGSGKAQGQEGHRSFVIPTFVAIALLQVSTGLPVIAARARMSPFEAGVYSAAATLANLVMAIAYVTTTIVFPRLVSRWTNGLDSTALVNTATLILLGTGLLTAVVAHLASTLVVGWIYTAPYMPAAGLLGGYVLAVTMQGAGLLWTYIHIAIQSRTFIWVFGGIVIAEVIALWACQPQPALFVAIVGISGLLTWPSGKLLFHRAYGVRQTASR